MQTIYMKYRAKKKYRLRNRSSTSTAHSSGTLVHLSSVNQYSVAPCPKNCDIAFAYSKGKLSAVANALLDEDAEAQIDD